MVDIRVVIKREKLALRQCTTLSMSHACTYMYIYTEPCPQALSKREGEPGIFSHMNDTEGRKDITVCRWAQLYFLDTQGRQQISTSCS